MFQDDGCENPPAQQGPPGLTLGAQPAFKPLDTRAAVIAGGTKHASLNRTSPLSHRFTLLNPPLATSRLSPITLRTKLQLKKGGQHVALHQHHPRDRPLRLGEILRHSYQSFDRAFGGRSTVAHLFYEAELLS